MANKRFNNTARAIKAKGADPELCGWFLLCANKATDSLPHPVLGSVPVCERCRSFVKGDAA